MIKVKVFQFWTQVMQFWTLSKLNAVVNDKSKFEVIETDDTSRLIIAREKSISRYIRKYLNGYDKNIIDNLISTGNQPDKLYGLTKIPQKKTTLRDQWYP